MEKEDLPIGRIAFAKAVCADWLSEYSKIILSCSIAIIVLIFCLFQLTSHLSGLKKSDYLQAQAAFSVWTVASIADAELFKKLEGPLKEHPELQSKFGALIAQRCLNLNEQVKASSYAKASLRRTGKLMVSHYASFSENSIRISLKKFPEALIQAKDLKESMEKDTAFWNAQDKMIHSGHLLYAYNLVRIAALERAVGSKDGEVLAWDAFLKNAGLAGSSKSANSQASMILAEAFQDGEISLFDFIEQRKKELKGS